MTLVYALVFYYIHTLFSNTNLTAFYLSFRYNFGAAMEQRLNFLDAVLQRGCEKCKKETQKRFDLISTNASNILLVSSPGSTISLWLQIEKFTHAQTVQVYMCILRYILNQNVSFLFFIVMSKAHVCCILNFYWQYTYICCCSCIV